MAVRMSSPVGGAQSRNDDRQGRERTRRSRRPSIRRRSPPPDRASGGGSVVPTFGSTRTQSQPGPASNGTGVQSSPSAWSLARIPRMATGPVTEIWPVDATSRSMPARRTGPAIATCRPPTSVVSGTTTRWPSPSTTALPPVTRCSRPSPSMRSAWTVMPAQSLGIGLGSGESGAVASAASSVTSRRCGAPGMAIAAVVGPGCRQGREGRRDRLAGLVRAGTSGSAPAASGSIESDRAAGHDPPDIDRLADRARHACHAIDRRDGRARPPSRASSGSRCDDAQVAAGPVRGLVGLRSRPGGGIRGRERAE